MLFHNYTYYLEFSSNGGDWTRTCQVWPNIFQIWVCFCRKKPMFNMKNMKNMAHYVGTAIYCHIYLQMGFTMIIWVVLLKIFYFHPYLGKIPILTNSFQMGWNHQPVYAVTCICLNLTHFASRDLYLHMAWKGPSMTIGSFTKNNHCQATCSNLDDRQCCLKETKQEISCQKSMKLEKVGTLVQLDDPCDTTRIYIPHLLALCLQLFVRSLTF